MFEETMGMHISGGWIGMRTACSTLPEAKVTENMLFCVFILFKHREVEVGCNPDVKTALA